MVIPHLFCMDEIHVVQRICLQVLKKIALFLHFRCEPPLDQLHFELMIHPTYFTQMVELWDVHYELVEQIWPCYHWTALGFFI